MDDEEIKEFSWRRENDGVGIEEREWVRKLDKEDFRYYF